MSGFKRQGKVTVKYDRKELRKRLVLEEWIVEQLGQLYGCEFHSLVIPLDFHRDAQIRPKALYEGPLAFLKWNTHKSTLGIAHLLPVAVVVLHLAFSRGERVHRKEVEAIPQKLGTEEEEEMPDVEIDIDDLLDAANEEERTLKLQETLVDCYKPTEEFIKELLTRIRGMRKLSPPQKKSI
ncbi:hypothetical protein Q9233_005650 [Columba guinea]|nr:hypothetical protein Q9233_005650 [Columba guinea]